MEQEGQAVEAVGVRDGKIVFTGTNEEAEKIESDEIIDIKGRAVFPGFIDYIGLREDDKRSESCRDKKCTGHIGPPERACESDAAGGLDQRKRLQPRGI